MQVGQVVKIKHSNEIRKIQRVSSNGNLFLEPTIERPVVDCVAPHQVDLINSSDDSVFSLMVRIGNIEPISSIIPKTEQQLALSTAWEEMIDAKISYETLCSRVYEEKIQPHEVLENEWIPGSGIYDYPKEIQVIWEALQSDTPDTQLNHNANSNGHKYKKAAAKFRNLAKRLIKVSGIK